MAYTIGGVAKALTSFVITAVATAAGLAHGADLSHLDAGQWLAVLGAAATAAGAVFSVPNKGAQPNIAAAPADHAIDAIQQTVQNAVHAQSELERVGKVVTDVLGSVPVLGPLTQQLLNSVPRL